MKIPIGIVDDHQLVLRSLGVMLNSFNNFEVVLEALNGKDLQEKISQKPDVPSIMLVDVNMPVMDGVMTAKWLNEQYPAMKLVALSMNDNDKTVIGMIKAGCCAYLLKDTHPNDLEKALLEINEKGYYNSDMININFRRLLVAEKELSDLQLTDKELEFLQHVCSDMTYKQISSIMHLSERTIEGYRNNLFQKFKVQSRVGLVLEALKKEYVKIERE